MRDCQRACPNVLVWFASGFGQGGGFGQSGGFGPTGGNVNPYAQPPGAMGPPPKKSKFWLWLLGGLAVAGILGVICCGGGTWWLFSLGSNMMGDELKREIAGDPNIAQHLGEVKSLAIRLIESGEETEKRGNGTQCLVFDAKGSLGNGKLIAEQSPNGGPGAMFSKIDLRLPSGEEISIK